MDFTAGPEGYSYVLTDGAVYTFDTWSIENGLEPIDDDELEIPGSCWWCGGPDWGLDIEVSGNHLYVATWGGLHVFDLEEPWNPHEVAFVPGRGPVRDVEIYGPAAYLADGHGLTVLDVRDPSEPKETKWLHLHRPVLAVGADPIEGKLYAVSVAKLDSFSIAANPFYPMPGDSIRLLGILLRDMKVEGEWVYLAGKWTQTIHNDPELGLTKEGPHDLQAWVTGRVLRDDRAERLQTIKNWRSVYEIWEKIE